MDKKYRGEWVIRDMLIEKARLTANGRNEGMKGEVMSFLHVCARCGRELVAEPMASYGDTKPFQVRPCRCTKTKEEEKDRVIASGEATLGKKEPDYATREELHEENAKSWNQHGKAIAEIRALQKDLGQVRRMDLNQVIQIIEKRLGAAEKLLVAFRHDIIRLENLTDPRIDDLAEIRQRLGKLETEPYATAKEMARGADRIWDKLTQYEQELAEFSRHLRQVEDRNQVLQKLHESMLVPVPEDGGS